MKRLICIANLFLAILGPCTGSIQEHQKETKQLELELLGKDTEDNTPSSIEAVRKRNEKLAAARLAAGLGGRRKDIPAPRSSEFSVDIRWWPYMSALWEYQRKMTRWPAAY